jgi:hypothetical protein
MAFLEAFVDELTKTARKESVLRRLGGRLPALAGMAAVGGGGAALGHALGKRKGIEEGTALTRDVAQRAYRAGVAGVEGGARAMRDAMLGAARHSTPRR